MKKFFGFHNIPWLILGFMFFVIRFSERSTTVHLSVLFIVFTYSIIFLLKWKINSKANETKYSRTSYMFINCLILIVAYSVNYDVADDFSIVSITVIYFIFSVINLRVIRIKYAYFTLFVAFISLMVIPLPPSTVQLTFYLKRCFNIFLIMWILLHTLSNVERYQPILLENAVVLADIFLYFSLISAISGMIFGTPSNFQLDIFRITGNLSDANCFGSLASGISLMYALISLDKNLYKANKTKRAYLGIKWGITNSLVISTLSKTCLLFLALMLAWYSFKILLKNKGKSLCFSISLVVVVFIILSGLYAASHITGHSIKDLIELIITKRKIGSKDLGERALVYYMVIKKMSWMFANGWFTIFFGVGIGSGYAFLLTSSGPVGDWVRFMSMHNTYAQILYEMGISGLGLFIIFLLMLIRNLKKKNKEIVLLYMIVPQVLLTLQYFIGYWIMLMVILMISYKDSSTIVSYSSKT